MNIPADLRDAAEHMMQEMRAIGEAHSRAMSGRYERERAERRAAMEREIADKGEPRSFSEWLPHLRNDNVEWQGLAWKTVMAMEPRPEMLEVVREALLGEDDMRALGAAAILQWLGKHLPLTAEVVEAAFVRIGRWDEDAGYDQIGENLREGFTELGPQLPLGPLVAALQEPNWRVRWLAMHGLRWMKANMPSDVFMQALADPDENVRSWAVRGLADAYPDILTAVATEAEAIVRGEPVGLLFTPIAQVYFARELARQPLDQPVGQEAKATLTDLRCSPVWGVRMEASRGLDALMGEGRAGVGEE